MNIKSILFGANQNPLYTDIGLLAVRLFTGLSMAFSHGINKIPPGEGMIEGIGELGFPVPAFFGWAAGLSEFLGGLLIALGIFTRPAALFLCITMVVAAFGIHGTDPFGKKEFALLYAAVALLLVFAGAGRFSVDNRIR